MFRAIWGVKLASASLSLGVRVTNVLNAPTIAPRGSVLHKLAMRSTTILCVRKNGHVVMAGDGQVSMGHAVCKGNARKVRRIGSDIIVGFAGSTADALTLLEKLERKLDEHPGQLMRACVELAKDWRSDKYLRRLEVIHAFAVY
jgi:ATP-dependent HslUV protease subunit HslV